MERQNGMTLLLAAPRQIVGARWGAAAARLQKGELGPVTLLLT